jgi:hypothetical protein
MRMYEVCFCTDFWGWECIEAIVCLLLLATIFPGLPRRVRLEWLQLPSTYLTRELKVNTDMISVVSVTVTSLNICKMYITETCSYNVLSAFRFHSHAFYVWVILLDAIYIFSLLPRVRVTYKTGSGFDDWIY